MLDIRKYKSGILIPAIAVLLLFNGQIFAKANSIDPVQMIKMADVTQTVIATTEDTQGAINSTSVNDTHKLAFTDNRQPEKTFTLNRHDQIVPSVFTQILNVTSSYATHSYQSIGYKRSKVRYASLGYMSKVPIL